MEQFVLLSILLHVLLIVLFGDAAGGGPRRGERLWGSLSVSMQQLLTERSAKAQPEPGADQSPSGAALLRRSGGLSDESGARPNVEKPASDAADTKDVTQIDPASRATDAAQPIVETAPSAPAAARQPLPFLAKETDHPVSDFVVPPVRSDQASAPSAELAAPLTPIAPIAAQEPALPAKFEREFVPEIEPVPRLTPIVPSAAPENLPSTRIRRDFALPMEPRPREVPIPPPPALERVPAPRIEREMLPPPKISDTPLAPPLPVERISPQRVEREFAPPSELKATEPLATPAPLAPLTPATRAEREFTAPPELKSRELPYAPPPLDRLNPPRIERELAPSSELRTRTVPAPAPAGDAASRPGQTSSPSPSADRKPADAKAPASGTPDVLDELFKSGARELPKPAAGSAPRLDLDSLKRQAREAAKEGNGPRTLLPFPTIAGKPERKTKEQEAFDKALKRPDCKDAYSGMGLAAVIPLVRDAIKDDGCKW